MKKQLLNQPIEDVINEVNLYKGIMIISIALVLALCTMLFVFIESNNDLQNKIEQLNAANQSLTDNLLNITAPVPPFFQFGGCSV